MGQTTSSLFTSMDSTTEDGGTEELDSQLLQIRQRLLSAIKLGSDCSGPLVDLLYLSCPVTMKYAVLNVKDILQNNNQTVQNLRNIPVALNILEKYGRHLIKPRSVRNELWRYVKFSNPIFRDRVDPLQGGRALMKTMGYTEEIQDGLLFPEPKEPDMDRTANMVADIILAKKEMEMYLSGSHPHPHAIEKFLPPNIVSDVEMLRVGVNISELCPPPASAPTPGPHAITQARHQPAAGAEAPQKQSAPVVEEVEEITMKLCDICGDQAATKRCISCDYKLLCTPCDQMWHTHPRRQNHVRGMTSLSRANVDLRQTETIQGPYGIQARPARDGGYHAMMTAAVSTAAAEPSDIQPEINNSQIKGQTFHKEVPPLSLNPKLSFPLKNLPRLDSLVLSHSSSGGIDLTSNTVPAASVPPPVRPVAPTTTSPTTFQQAIGLPQYVEPVSVYFPPENITHPLPSPTMPIISSTTRSSDLHRSDSMASSKLLAKIKEEKNSEKQIAKCDIHILTLGEEIDDIEDMIRQLVEINESFYDDEEFMKLNRKKGLLMREKIMLEKYRQEVAIIYSKEEPVESMPASQVVNVSSQRPFSFEKHGSGLPGYPNQPPGAPHPHMAFSPSTSLYASHMMSPTDNLNTGHVDENVYYSAVGQPRTKQASQKQHLHSNKSSYGITGFVPQLLNPQHQFHTAEPMTSKTDAHGRINAASQPVIPEVSTTHSTFDSKSVSEGKHNKVSANQKNSNGQPSGSMTVVTSTVGAVLGEQPQSGYKQKWQCEHCTMFNDAGTRICGMCHRTSDNPTYIEEGSASPAPDPSQESCVVPTSEETHVVSTSAQNIGRKIAQEQDQVYMEKQEAHRQYQELLKKEAEGKLGTESCKQSPTLYHIDTKQQSSPPAKDDRPKEQATVISSREVDQPGSSPGSSGAALSSEDSGNSFRQATFQETMESINEQRHVKKTQLDGADLLQIIKTADQEGFEVEEVIVALENCEREPKSALEWLKTSWDNLVERVVNMVTIRSQDCEQNNIGILSIQEAKKALQECNGHVEEAVALCINARLKLYADINNDEMYPRENVLEAMHEHEGNKDLVQRHLDMVRLVPFKDRIWKDSDSRDADVMQLPLSPNCTSVSTSVISHQDFQDMVCNDNIDLERRIRMVLVEARLQSWGRAETVIKILEQDLRDLEEENDYDYTLEDVVEAVRNCQDRRSSVVYLQRECVICMSKFPMTKMMNLNICQCQMCRECLRKHFEISIKEKHVRNWTCPVCSLPDFNDENVSGDYLNLLGLMLKTFVDKDIQDLFETKVRDWHLQKDPNFRWCAHCGNGFLYQGWQDGRGQLAMQCQQCSNRTCFLCKKQWEPQHEGLSCEQFEQWKIDNDPNNQAARLAKLLEESGIDCPSCKMRYSLAKGGCMHFKCPECAHEFCSGCSQPFYKHGACHRFKQCTSQGLHCHHPRDCFFYLRDNDIDELQKLLKLGNIQYNTDEGQEASRGTCPVMEQKDMDVGSRQDEACGKEVAQGNAGLCSVHYKEYLVSLINRHKLDPVNIMTHEQIQRLLARMEFPEQKKKEKESQNQFKKRLSLFIKQQVPLKR